LAAVLKDVVLHQEDHLEQHLRVLLEKSVPLALNGHVSQCVEEGVVPEVEQVEEVDLKWTREC
jgi:hypothetical protein